MGGSLKVEGGGAGGGEDYQALICARELTCIYCGIFFLSRLGRIERNTEVLRGLFD